MSMSAAVENGRLRARGVSRLFEIRLLKARSLKETIVNRRLPPKRQIWALRDVDLDVEPGQTFGVVGQNGSGKSTLLKLLAGVFAPSSGELEVGGRVGSLIEVGAGFHPEFTGIENVYLNAAIHGISRAYVDEHLDEIIAFSELEDFADVPVKTYSSGMFMRLGFSVAMHIEPDVLLVDEVLAVGDEQFQQKCFGKIWEFKRRGGTIVFVSHDPRQVEFLCDRAILLESGRVTAEGTSGDVLRAYHRSLARRAVPLAATGDRRPSGRCRVQEIRAKDRDGTLRDRLMDREPFVIEALLYSDTGIKGANVTIAVRETSGREIGSQSIPGVDLRPERMEAVRLHMDEPPLRDGRFFVDVRVLSHDGDEELAELEGGLELTFFSDDAAAGGPVAFRGVWELPAEQPVIVADAANAEAS
jgi:ABC-type polysaccharide/polyol phosphate transport system ATPase subunit